MPDAAVDLSARSLSLPGRATEKVTVSPLVWLIQLQATPPSATAIAAALPARGMKPVSRPKFVLKSYIACAEIRLLQPIVTGFPLAGALGVALGGAGLALAEGEDEAETDALGVGSELEVGLDFGEPTHPESPIIATALSVTISVVVRNRPAATKTMIASPSTS